MSAYEASTAKMLCPDGKNYLMKVLIDASVFPQMLIERGDSRVQVRVKRRLSKFNPSLKRDHARGTVASQPNAQQAGRRRDRAFERSESGRNRRAGYAGFDFARQSEVGMIECVEHLSVEAECDPFFNWKSLADVDVRIRVMRSAYGVPSGIAELAVRRRIAAHTCSRRRIDHRDEGFRVEPLFGARDGDAGNRTLLIHWHARNPVRVSGRIELDGAGSVRLKHAVAVGDVRLAEHAEGQAGVQDCGLRDRPPSKHLTKERMVGVEWHLVQTIGGDVMANVVVTTGILPV